MDLLNYKVSLLVHDCDAYNITQRANLIRLMDAQIYSIWVRNKMHNMSQPKAITVPRLSTNIKDINSWVYVNNTLPCLFASILDYSM